jgi:hypothetical protein
MSDIHPNVVRVTAAAKERGLEISTRRFPEGTKPQPMLPLQLA